MMLIKKLSYQTISTIALKEEIKMIVFVSPCKPFPTATQHVNLLPIKILAITHSKLTNSIGLTVLLFWENNASRWQDIQIQTSKLWIQREKGLKLVRCDKSLQGN